MKIFMLGWEFPPHISGGLGTACYGMTKGLDEIGVEVCFVLPTAVPVDTSSHVQFRSPSNLAEARNRDIGGSHTFEHVSVHRLEAMLQPYGTVEGFEQAVSKVVARQRQLATAEDRGATAGKAKAGAPLPSGSFYGSGGAHYGGDLLGQVHRYARLAVELAEAEQFDIVHAHDWMTYPAGVAVSAATGKPLVIHVHSTEFDRSGENINRQVYMIERNGMHNADKVVCVSHLTRNAVVSRYDVTKTRKSSMPSTCQTTPSCKWYRFDRMRRSFCSWAASRCKKARNISSTRPRRSSRSTRMYGS